jgi:voltage-gated potassium channel
MLSRWRRLRAQVPMPEPEPRVMRAENWIDRRLTAKALRPRYAAYVIAAIWLFAIVVFAVIERIADPETFGTIWLALWWAIQTVTTVGYGDVVPQQTSGKVLASFLMLGGLSLLSIVTATITSAFVARRQAEIQAAGEDPVIDRLDELAARLDRIEAKLHPPGGEEPPPGSRPHRSA